VLLWGLLLVWAAAWAAEPVRIPIECEDMRGVKGPDAGFTREWTFGRWGTDLHQNMIFGGPWASRMAAAITDAGNNQAEAYADIEVPRADRYKVWAKYECPPNFNYAFGIRIERLGADGTPGEQVFARTYGLREAAKHYNFTNDVTAGDLYWTWGIDHDAAEGYETDLAAGTYRVTLVKLPNRAPAGERSVDAILITTKLDTTSAPDFPRYPLLDELQQINHVYFRFTNTGTTPVVFDYNHWSHRYNHFYAMGNTQLVRFYDAAGTLLTDAAGQPLVRNGGQWNTPVLPGQSTPWIDLGPTMTVEAGSPFFANAAAVNAQGAKLAPQPAEVPFTMEIALAPGQAGIVKSFQKPAGWPQLVVNVQPDLHRPDGVDSTLLSGDVYGRMTRTLEAIPRVGPVPKKLRLYGSAGFPTWGPKMTPASPAFPVYADYCIALGLNTLTSVYTDPDLADALVASYAKKGVGLVEFSGTYHHTQDVEALKKIVQDPRVKDRFYYVSFGDEIGLPAVDLQDEQLLADFRAFITARKVKPQDLGFKTLAEVKPLASFTAQGIVGVGLQPATADGQPALPTGAAARPFKRLFWLTHEFAIDRGIHDFAKTTQAMTALLGPQFKTSANLGGMHPFYWMHQSSFIESFRGGAMTLAWSEDYDYCQPEASRLCIDFQSAMLRAGAKYHDTPMMFYNMPHYPGNTGRHLLQNAVSLWGQGVKDLDFFCVAPDLFSTENYLHSRGGAEVTGAAIRRISGMAGNIEDDLLPARTRPARVAMLLSEASDVWELGGGGQWDVKPGSDASNVTQEERKAIWYALRHAGYLVDLLTERDVNEGRLAPYKVLYVSGRNIEQATAKNVAAWVKAGGVVYLTAEAARRDEYDMPFTGLDAVVGRGAAVKTDRYKGPLRAKLELLWLEPKTAAHLKGLDAQYNAGEPGPPGAPTIYRVYASLETFAPAKGATVLGTLDDGSPALVCAKSGKGWGYYTGTLPGQAFVRAALPIRVMGKGGPDTGFSHFEVIDFDRNAWKAILAPVVKAGLASDLMINKRGVVGNILTGPASTVVTLNNLARQQDGTARDVTVRLPGVRPAKAVRTALHAPATFTNEKDGVTISLPEIDDADVVVITH